MSDSSAGTDICGRCGDRGWLEPPDGLCAECFLIDSDNPVGDAIRIIRKRDERIVELRGMVERTEWELLKEVAGRIAFDRRDLLEALERSGD